MNGVGKVDECTLVMNNNNNGDATSSFRILQTLKYDLRCYLYPKVVHANVDPMGFGVVDPTDSTKSLGRKEFATFFADADDYGDGNDCRRRGGWVEEQTTKRRKRKGGEKSKGVEEEGGNDEQQQQSKVEK